MKYLFVLFCLFSSAVNSAELYFDFKIGVLLETNNFYGCGKYDYDGYQFYMNCDDYDDIVYSQQEIGLKFNIGKPWLDSYGFYVEHLSTPGRGFPFNNKKEPSFNAAGIKFGWSYELF